MQIRALARRPNPTLIIWVASPLFRHGHVFPPLSQNNWLHPMFLLLTLLPPLEPHRPRTLHNLASLISHHLPWTISPEPSLFQACRLYSTKTYKSQMCLVTEFKAEKTTRMKQQDLFFIFWFLPFGEVEEKPFLPLDFEIYIPVSL